MQKLLVRLRNTFLPHEDNGRHPYLFRLEAALGVLAVIAIIECAPFFGAALLQTSEQLASVLPGVVTALTNDQRAADKLANLTPNPLLTDAAQAAANDMATNGYFAHVSPEGKDPWYWFNKVDYKYQYAGENLAVNFNDSQQVVDAWMDSPTHRANILGTHYTEIGVGMATGIYQGAPAIFVVQFFAAPLEKTSSLTEQAPVNAVVVAESASSTQKVLAATSQIVNPAAPVSFWTRVISSPYTSATEALLALAAVITLIYILGFALKPFTSHFLHREAAIIGLSLILIIVGALALNYYVLFNKATLPAGGQAAAVVLSQPVR